MIIDPNDPFAGIDESEFEAELKRDIKPTTNEHVEQIGDTEIPGFVEDCPKCNGTGKWRGTYVTRTCFKCKGTGKLQFKTSPEARAKSRKYAQKRKVADAKEHIDLFALTYPVEAEWLNKANERGNNFAQSLLQGIAKYGSLTEGQMNAVRNAIARDDDRKAGFEEWQKSNEEVAAWLLTESEGGNEFAGSLLNAVKRFGSLTEGQEAAVRRNLDKQKAVSEEKTSDLDISGLKGYYAVPGGDTRLKICVRSPGKNSRWYGWTFVDDGAAYGNRQTYGRQPRGGTYQGKIQDELRKILENPLEAQKAYGHLTGTCGRCGRILEDEESIKAGIGPICATKA